MPYFDQQTDFIKISLLDKQNQQWCLWITNTWNSVIRFRGWYLWNIWNKNYARFRQKRPNDESLVSHNFTCFKKPGNVLFLKCAFFNDIHVFQLYSWIWNYAWEENCICPYLSFPNENFIVKFYKLILVSIHFWWLIKLLKLLRSTRTFRRAKLASYSGYPVILGSENDRRVFKSVSANQNSGLKIWKLNEARIVKTTNIKLKEGTS